MKIIALKEAYNLATGDKWSSVTASHRNIVSEHAFNVLPELVLALQKAESRLKCANLTRSKKQGEFMVSDLEDILAKANQVQIPT